MFRPVKRKIKGGPIGFSLVYFECALQRESLQSCSSPHQFLLISTVPSLDIRTASRNRRCVQVPTCTKSPLYSLMDIIEIIPWCDLLSTARYSSMAQVIHCCRIHSKVCQGTGTSRRLATSNMYAVHSAESNVDRC